MPAKLTTEEFIERAKAVHGDKYDYQLVDYKNNSTKVRMLCIEHNIYFLQSPQKHMSGQIGCSKCRSELGTLKDKITKDEFISRAVSTHGNMYDYSNIKYTNRNTKVDILCTCCGNMFSQSPAKHMAGQGCAGCGHKRAGVSKRMSKEQFIIAAERVHGVGRYSYSKSDYITSDSIITITCPIHGDFVQAATKHIHGGDGCPSCSTGGFNPLKESVIYVLMDEEGTVKIGISNHSGKYRAGRVSMSSCKRFCVVHEVLMSGIDCQRVESKMLNWLRESYKNPPEKFDGYTECFLGVSVTDVINRLHKEIDKLYN